MSDGKPKLRSMIRALLQSVVGFDNFRFLLSRFTLRFLHKVKIEADFVHFLSMVPTDQPVLDIGANFGIMTVSLARKAVNGQVYSFEPIPENGKALKRLVKHYKLNNVNVFDCAIGDKPGELKMVLPVVDDLKIHGLSHVIGENDTDQGEVFTVPVKRLDDIPELKELKSIGAIKIDVENFEYEAFVGGKELLLKHKPIIFCEIWTNEKRDRTMDYLKNELGYTINVFDGAKLVPFTGGDGSNYFLLP